MALGPSPQSEIWEKALAAVRLLPEVKLVQVSPHGSAVQDGASYFATSIDRYSGNRLDFVQSGVTTGIATDIAPLGYSES